jgi:hypothetical protein
MVTAANMEVHDCRFSHQVCCQARSRKADVVGLQLDFDLVAVDDEGTVLDTELAAAPILD